MKSHEDLEKALKHLAHSEMETELTPSQVKAAVHKAHEHVAYREGLGFLTALLWVFVAGFGLKFWDQMHRSHLTSSASRPPAHRQGDKP